MIAAGLPSPKLDYVSSSYVCLIKHLKSVLLGHQVDIRDVLEAQFNHINLFRQ